MQIANITLPDASAVDKVFKPVLKDGMLISYADTTASSQAEFEQLTLGMRKPQSGVARKVTIKVVQPYSVVLGDKTTIENITAFLEVVVPVDADKTAANNLLSFASGALVNDQIKDAIVNGAFPY